MSETMPEVHTRPGAGTERLPFVTVVMPVRNEADFLERGLGAAMAQDYPKNRMEILVADGMSKDGTREIVERWARARPIPGRRNNPYRSVSIPGCP